MPIGRTVLEDKRKGAAGQRNWLVTIRAGVDATDDAGFPFVQFSDLRTQYMSRTPLRADERDDRAAQESSYGQESWRFPWSEDMDPETVNVMKYRQFEYLGRTFDIITCSMVEWRKEVEAITLQKP